MAAGSLSPSAEVAQYIRTVLARVLEKIPRQNSPALWRSACPKHGEKAVLPSNEAESQRISSICVSHVALPEGP